MEFARKQLEKYGWSDGKGLGKYEDGISEPLKAKIKHSVTGVGYDPAADFTEHWWSTLYDKAASNLEVENKNGKTKKIRRKSKDEFEITNSTWKLKKKNKKKEIPTDDTQYADFFVRTAVIGQGGDTTTRVRVSDSESEDEPDTVKLTDEELFAACQGRTAHKGARHGLRALGKLARIEQQEKILLQQTKYKGYTQHEKIKNISNEDSNTEINTVIKEKKKIHSCNTVSCSDKVQEPEIVPKHSVTINEDKLVTGKKLEHIIELNTYHADIPEDKEITTKKKKKKNKCNKIDNSNNINLTENLSNNSVAEYENELINATKSSNSKHKIIELNTHAEIPEDAEIITTIEKKKKKKCTSKKLNLN